MRVISGSTWGVSNSERAPRGIKTVHFTPTTRDLLNLKQRTSSLFTPTWSIAGDRHRRRRWRRRLIGVRSPVDYWDIWAWAAKGVVALVLVHDWVVGARIPRVNTYKTFLFFLMGLMTMMTYINCRCSSCWLSAVSWLLHLSGHIWGIQTKLYSERACNPEGHWADAENRGAGCLGSDWDDLGKYIYK